MKAAQVHDLKDDELVAKLIDAKQEVFNLRFRHATGELENTAAARHRAARRRKAFDRRAGAWDRRRERAEEDMSEDEKKDETTDEAARARVRRRGGQAPVLAGGRGEELHALAEPRKSRPPRPRLRRGAAAESRCGRAGGG